MKCENPSESCDLRICENCDPIKMVEYVAENLDYNGIIHISHQQWITKPWTDLIYREDVEVDAFLALLRIILEKQVFTSHLFET